MIIKRITHKKEAREFLHFPVSLYRNNPYWIRPLDKDILSVFDKTKNSIAKKENFERWLLYDDNRKLIGRIAAFINPKTKLKNNDYPVGGIGFFECINRQEAANLLFDTAKKWLEDRGIEAMEGPINFGDRDRWWGLLVKGFEEEPNYLANYNFPYYQALFENYGFKLYFNQFTFKRKIDKALPEIYLQKAKALLKHPDYKFQHIRKKQIDKYTEDFRIIYNQAWAKHVGVSAMQPRQARAIMKSLKPVLDEKVAWFAYYKDTPIGFFISVPEVNQIFKHVNGKLNLWGKLIFLKHKLLKTNQKLLGIIFGVIPEFDGKSITHALTYIAQETMIAETNYKSIEMHGIGDFNPAMLKLIAKLQNSEKSKIHTTYRYLFDKNRPYTRMPLKTNTRNEQ